jgi:diacylglycerol kinase family enzyme
MTRAATAEATMAAAGRRRFWAWVALLALVAVPVGVVVIVVRSEGRLLGVGLVSLICLGVALAAIWWAFTTRRAWKRRLNLVIAAALLLALVVNLVAFGLAEAGAVLATVVAALIYPTAARRALTTDSSRLQTAGEGSGAGAGAAPVRPWLVVNPRSGGGKAERYGLVGAARERGVMVRVLAPGDDIVQLVRDAVADGADAIGVAGGDGSLGRVAAVAIEHDLPFVCVPAGTRNHFAQDLGLDRTDPRPALDAFAGRERRIDVGVLNGQMFVNNVSLGAYADVVAEPGYRNRKLGTAHEVLPALLRGDRELLPVSVSDPYGHSYSDALVLLVANNRYDLSPQEFGARDRLDDGVLQVSVLRAYTGAALLGVVRRGLTRTQPEAWAQWTTPAVQIDSRLATLPVGVDGESAILAPPLRFEVRPGALRVLVPPALRPRSTVLRPFRWPTVRRLGAMATGHDSAAR